MKNTYLKSGQVGIIAVLLGVVIFTMGMATAARVTTDVRIATRTEEGIRANAAAESAMEIAMASDDRKLIGTPSGTWEDGTGYIGGDYTATPLPDDTQVPYVYEFSVNEGESRTIWLVNLARSAIPNVSPLHPSLAAYSDKFEITWIGADTASASDQRVELSFYWRNSSDQILVKRWFKAGGENFLLIDPNDTATFNANFPNFQQFYLVRIKPIKGNIDAAILPNPGTDFPIQEFSIVANGWTNVSSGQVRRRTVGSRVVGELPLFLDYVVASGGDLRKQ